MMDDLIKRDDALAAIQDYAVQEVGAFRQPHLKGAADAILALPAVTVEEPTEAQIASACLSYDHSFGLMDGPERVALMHQAREWFHAWRKEYVK